MNARKKGAREGDTRGEREVSPSRAPVLSCAHYFQAPATQASVPVFPKCRGKPLIGFNVSAMTHADFRSCDWWMNLRLDSPGKTEPVCYVYL